MKITLQAINGVLRRFGVVLVVGGVPDGTEEGRERPLLWFTIQRAYRWIPFGAPR